MDNILNLFHEKDQPIIKERISKDDSIADFLPLTKKMGFYGFLGIHIDLKKTKAFKEIYESIIPIFSFDNIKPEDDFFQNILILEEFRHIQEFARKEPSYIDVMVKLLIENKKTILNFYYQKKEILDEFCHSIQNLITYVNHSEYIDILEEKSQINFRKLNDIWFEYAKEIIAKNDEQFIELIGSIILMVDVENKQKIINYVFEYRISN